MNWYEMAFGYDFGFQNSNHNNTVLVEYLNEDLLIEELGNSIGKYFRGCKGSNLIVKYVKALTASGKKKDLGSDKEKLLVDWLKKKIDTHAKWEWE